MAFDLSGKVAVVTGATGLLGTQHCDALAESGCTVVALDLKAEVCDALANKLAKAHGGKHLGMAVDISSRDSVLAVKETTLQQLGRIDVLVNNAAIDDKFDNSPAALEASRFENYPLERWRASIDVNVTGTFLCCQVFGAEMASRKSGSIINVASTYGLVAPDQALYQRPDGSQMFYKSAAYPTGKAAVVGLTRFVASYWGPVGVRCNTLCPGGVYTGQDDHFVSGYAQRTPLKRMAQATDYRGAVVFLASDESAYMNGSNLVVDGGFTAW